MDTYIVAITFFYWVMWPYEIGQRESLWIGQRIGSLQYKLCKLYWNIHVDNCFSIDVLCIFKSVPTQSFPIQSGLFQQLPIVHILFLTSIGPNSIIPNSVFAYSILSFMKQICRITPFSKLKITVPRLFPNIAKGYFFFWKWGKNISTIWDFLLLYHEYIKIVSCNIGFCVGNKQVSKNYLTKPDNFNKLLFFYSRKK